jgi:hypothetical protein
LLTLDTAYMSPHVATAPAAAYSSAHSAGWDPHKNDVWIDLLRPQVSAESKPKILPYQWVAVQYGQALWQQFVPYGNSHDTIGGYFSTDALRSPIRGINSAHIFSEAIGFWQPLAQQETAVPQVSDMTSLITRIDEYLSRDAVDTDRPWGIL